MNAVTPAGTTSDSQQILFRARASGLNVNRALKINSAGTLLFNGTEVSLSGHTHTFDSLTSKPTTLAGYGITDAEPAFTKNTAFNKDFGTTEGTVAEGDHTHSIYLSALGDTMTGDLTLDKDGETEVGSHGIVFNGNSVFLDGDYSKELNMSVGGLLKFDNTEVSLSGHTHTEYLPKAGGIMTGALVLRGQTDNYDGEDRSSYWDYDNKVALALEPAADDGATAILFKSVGNVPSDFAYIAYDEDYGEAGVTAGENGVLLLSAQNDGTGSSDHVRVKGRFVVEAVTSSSDPTNAFEVKSSNVTSNLFHVPRAGEAYVNDNKVHHAGNLTFTETGSGSSKTLTITY
jgi:hypothetical protein